ncbi:ATPase domain-containing protein [Streptomyces sp. NPDC059009]|uniref:ATPase domain-containing protein n=1 Tax=Streptomyces sp. NPDC059009 TaxID=3346694 RepID=UPI0036927C43
MSGGGHHARRAAGAARLATGISGFDQLALGGLPDGRATLVAGTTGSGKTLFALEFLARGVLAHDEPGVFVTFEETPEDIRRNALSLGFTVADWEADGRWVFVDATPDLNEESPVIGAYDFTAVLARIRRAVEAPAPAGSPWTPSTPSSCAFPTRRSSGTSCCASPPPSKPSASPRCSPRSAPTATA